jgi:hypothetical protein
MGSCTLGREASNSYDRVIFAPACSAWGTAQVYRNKMFQLQSFFLGILITCPTCRDCVMPCELCHLGSFSILQIATNFASCWVILFSKTANLIVPYSSVTLLRSDAALILSVSQRVFDGDLFICLFIFSLRFLSNPDYIASSERMIGEWCIGRGRKWSWPNVRYYPGICLKGLRKPTKILNQDSRSPGGDLNPVLSEYEAAV